MKNYYEILEVNQKASEEIIKKVFKIQVKKYHPDAVAQDKKTEAEEKIKELNEAYEILSSPEKRQAYDEELKLQELNDDEITNLRDENTFLREKLDKQNKLIEDLINKSQDTDYQGNDYFNNEDVLTDEENDTLNNEEYIRKLNFKYSLIDFIFKIIVILILICLGIYAIYLLTDINLLTLFF